MAAITAKILPPTAEEIEAARKELYDKLEKAEKQPNSEKRSAEEVFAEKRERLEELFELQAYCKEKDRNNDRVYQYRTRL